MKKIILQIVPAGIGVLLGTVAIYLTKDPILAIAIGVVIILILNLIEKKIKKE